METLQYAMNSLAGTLSGGVPTRDAQGAANVWAGTTGLDIVAALNVKAGNTLPGYKELQGVLNQLAGTTGLAVDAAATAITDGTGPGFGDGPFGFGPFGA